MKIVVIHGVEHKGSTYNASHLLLEHLKDSDTEIREFFLPKDMPHFCKGCTVCFMKSETECPHYSAVLPILTAMEASDLLVFTSPVYVYHVTGQMKAFLDHFGYQWIVHRPKKSMFSKKAVIITTGAGGGMKSTAKDVVDSLSFWGISRIFTYGTAVKAISWNGVKNDTKSKIEKDMENLARKILSSSTSPSLKTKIMFYFFRNLQKNHPLNPADRDYWAKQGWLEEKRPWKD